ncbi:hypothetical protein INR49_014900 [Caranx melampygus]|nr:hypothetical protein INR49_014900 [Caranx melampygus]
MKTWAVVKERYRIMFVFTLKTANMSKREALLEATCKENAEDFLNFIRLHNDKADPFDVEEVVQEMPRNQRQALWKRLTSLLQDVLQELPPERWEEDREEGMEMESAKDPKHVMAVVDGVALVALLSLTALQDGDTYSDLLETAHKLHGVLVSLPVLEAPLQLHIHALCEGWWKKGLKEKETFGRTAFLISLQRTFILKKPIMRYFHTRKGCHKGEKMLYNLYRPFLWKALSAPNSEVRANATLLFTEAFPLHDPDQSENIDENVQKQLDTAMALLEDPNPTVRSSATLGVCKILAKCWELLPATIITDFLEKLLKELAADTSSADVRCSVFKCLTIVLDNGLSHPLMEKLLPTVKYSLHDTSEKVRVAFLDMLIKVKAVRAAKFWDVCSMDNLLARLAIDSHSVSKRIADLLCKSFFPANESEREWCCRCITLIQMNPTAARKFYQCIYEHTAPTNIIKLMLAIRRVLNSCIPTDCDLTEINDGDKENSAAEPVKLDKPIVAVLLEIVVILWKSIEEALKQNEEVQKYTIAKFGNVISKYFQAFEDERCTIPLIHLASFLPPAAVPTFSCGVLSRLRRMDPGAVPAQYSQLLDCICSWGQVADILDLITEWLTEALPKQGEKANTSRKVRIQETVEAKPDMALAYLEYLFSHTATQEKVLALGQRPLKQLHTALGNWKSVLYTHLSSTTEDPQRPSLETALKAFVFHGRLGAHLQNNSSEGRDYLISLENVAAWVAERVLPFLAKSTTDDGEDSEKPLPLAAQITESFLTVCRDILLVGLGDETFKGQILQLCSLVLLSEAGYLCIPAVLPVLKEVADSYAPDYDQDQENQEDPTTVILGVVTNIFHTIIEHLVRCLRKTPEEGKLLCQSAVPGLTEFLQVAQMWDREPLSGVFATLSAVMIVEKKHLLQKVTHPEEVITPESVEDMPPLSSVLLSVILKSPSLSRAFLSEVSSTLDSDAISSLNDVAAILHILAVIKHTGQSKASLKRAATSAQQQLYRHAVTSVDSIRGSPSNDPYSCLFLSLIHPSIHSSSKGLLHAARIIPPHHVCLTSET